METPTKLRHTGDPNQATTQSRRVDAYEPRQSSPYLQSTCLYFLLHRVAVCNRSCPTPCAVTVASGPSGTCTRGCARPSCEPAAQQIPMTLQLRQRIEDRHGPLDTPFPRYEMSLFYFVPVCLQDAEVLCLDRRGWPREQKGRSTGPRPQARSRACFPLSACSAMSRIFSINAFMLAMSRTLLASSCLLVSNSACADLRGHCA